MKKIVVLSLVLCLVVLAGCATLALSPEERELAQDFDTINPTPQTDKYIRDMGLDPNHLTQKEKAKVMAEMDKIFGLVIY